MKTKVAIQYFGSIAKLADALGYSRQAIYKWGENVPDPAAYKLEVITYSKLRANSPEKDRRQRSSAASIRSGAKSKAGGKKMAADCGGRRSVAK